ncbi:MAG: T9SS type A sorting domain-containing protein [Bacteroidia bacterium]
MKLILLILAIAIISPGFVQAQPCQPDTTKKEVGIYPKPVIPATVGQMYDENLTLRFPKDTTYMGNDIEIDSITIVKVDRLPQGFSYTCNIPGCTYPGGGVGCVNVQGLPDASMQGSRYVLVTVRGYVTLFGNVVTMSSVDSIEFIIQNPDGINEDVQTLKLLQNYPNPFKTSTIFSFMLPDYNQVSLSIFNLVGREVFRQYIQGNPGLNKVEFKNEDLTPGMYFYRLKYGDEELTRRMTISR